MNASMTVLNNQLYAFERKEHAIDFGDPYNMTKP